MPWLFNRWLALFGMSLFVCKDCQSLFLRHNETGKCIAASDELVYNNSNYAFPYFVVMTDNCLDSKAEFRYLDGELLHNIKKNGTLVSPTGSNYRSRWAVYKGISEDAKRIQISAEHHLKQTAAGSLFFYHTKEPTCAEPEPSKYVKRKSYCNKTQQVFTFGSVTAFNAKMENVSCSSIQRMMVNSADYGHFNVGSKFNNSASQDTQCSKLTNCQVKSVCSGNRSCELTMDSNLLPSQYCSDTSKQIYTMYNCVDTYSSSAITTAPKIRLTRQNNGLIEINDGSKWKRVVEETWGKNRQKMLCQHLGFGESNGNKIEMRKLGKGQSIATGDLICYNIKQRKTSCCVYLHYLTTTKSTRIPYVRCKICNNPQLHKPGVFPNSAFSGKGDSRNKYKDARITKGGWCPSGLGSVYLLLDLQKEYHITGVVVMADKAQTKWSGSYSLKYSLDKSYKNYKAISGNQNGYQASRTNLNIYNVRHMKIESTGNRNFCLRIELCGVVQRPAPVSSLKVSPWRYAARVTWKISKSPQDSSYITKIVIYLNNQQRMITSRRTQVIIDGLLPYTLYNVGIETQDGSSQKSNNVTKNFRTQEAAPSGPPLNVVFTSRGKYSLKVAWEAPNQPWNGKQKGYKVCYSVKKNSSSVTCSELTKLLSYNISQLQPSTKYFVTVSAATSAGNGPESLEVSKITNGEPANPVAISYFSLNVSIAKQELIIKEVMVIVQITPKTSTPVEDIEAKDLKPYQTNTQTPYITAYFKADILPLTLVVGDNREFIFENRTYHNHPLKHSSSYIVFLRFFETKDSFFSTEWSSGVKTLPVPPPKITKILSTAPKKYTIFWVQPTLPVLKYYASYRAFNRSNHSYNVSKDNTFIIINVEYEQRYIFEIQAVTKAGISDVASKNWTSHSAPLELPIEANDSYTVKLRKPKNEKNIKTVTLVLLKSESENPPAPEDIQLQKSPPLQEENNIAFIAKVLDITEFQEDTIEISLKQSRDKRRKKRNAVVVPVLALMSTYRAAQLNTDAFGVDNISELFLQCFL